MESIKNKVAIVGMGCVKFGENFNKSIDDMMIDAAYEAYEDAGIDPSGTPPCRLPCAKRPCALPNGAHQQDGRP